MARRILSVVLSALLALPVHADTHQAASCSTTNVQTAVDAASDGDTVTIPDGSCTWTSGISTTKQIWIRALNYTPTSGGTCTRNVTLTNNSSDPLFSFTTGNSFHAALSGIRVNEISDSPGSDNHVEFTGSGTKVFLMSDMCFEVGQRNGSSTEVAVLDSSAGGGVLWHMRFIGRGPSPVGGNGPDGASFIIKGQPRHWETASTIGSLDTNGTVNLYLEDSSCFNVGQWPDGDDHARYVSRFNEIDGCSGLTHGFTGPWGGRHFEFYGNHFKVTDEERPISGRYFWLRAGTVQFSSNIVDNSVNPGGWGNVDLFSIGDNTSPGSYPMDRQPGWGHNGSIYVIDPVYVANNTGDRADDWSYQDQPGGWENIVLENREFYINTGSFNGTVGAGAGLRSSRPSTCTTGVGYWATDQGGNWNTSNGSANDGCRDVCTATNTWTNCAYTPYTYPHPLRSELEGGGGPPPFKRKISGKATISGRTQ